MKGINIGYFHQHRRYYLCRWLEWFFLVNLILFLFLGIRYLEFLPNLSTVSSTSSGGIALGWIFLITSFIAQLVTLFLVPGLILVTAVSLFPQRWFIFSLSIGLFSLLLFLLIADCIAFGLYHMHYAGVAWSIFQAGAVAEVILLSWPERFMLLGIMLVLLVIEYCLALFIWRLISWRSIERQGYIILTVFIAAGFFSYGLMCIADGRSAFSLSSGNAQIIFKMAHLVPYYEEVYSQIIPHVSETRQIYTKSGFINVPVRDINRPLKYPLHPMQCANHKKKKMNILIIAIDAWRYDAFNEKVTPHIFQFASRAMQFRSHWSGGNCTKSGLISLFYGLPSNYWSSLLKQQRGPVLIHELLGKNYQMGIFTSAPLNFPAFNQTIFREVDPLLLRVEGENSLERDENITKRFHSFLKTRNKEEPFFGFVFYDAAHNYCESTIPKEQPFQPAVPFCNRFSLTSRVNPEPYLNRYHNALYFVDAEINKVLDAVKSEGLLDQTLIIITSDHGEQFNDERMGYWNHASAYTPYQLHVPLLVYWPGKAPKIYDHWTTHYDIVPTVMPEIMECDGSTEDYGVGESLFSTKDRSFFIAGSYADYAIITSRSVTRIYPGGDYVVNNLTGHLIRDEHLNHSALRKACNSITKYFQSKSL